MGCKEYTPQDWFAYCEFYDNNCEECQNCPNKSIDITTALLRQECIAFYDVFKHLEQHLECSGIVEKSLAHDMPTLILVPYVVNGAFACELALKYVLINNKLSFRLADGHNLKYLFDLLPQNVQIELKDRLKTAANIDDEKLEENIELLSHSFVQWRYYFSNIEKGICQSSFFGILVNELCAYILQ